MSVSIKNTAREVFVLNLDPNTDYGDHPECKGSTFKMAQVAELPEGQTGVRHYERKLPGSLTWLSGETKAGLPDEVAKAPQLARRVLLGLMVVTEDPEPETVIDVTEEVVEPEPETP